MHDDHVFFSFTFVFQTLKIKKIRLQYKGKAILILFGVNCLVLLSDKYGHHCEDSEHIQNPANFYTL